MKLLLVLPCAALDWCLQMGFAIKLYMESFYDTAEPDQVLPGNAYQRLDDCVGRAMVFQAVGWSEFCLCAAYYRPSRCVVGHYSVCSGTHQPFVHSSHLLLQLSI